MFDIEDFDLQLKMHIEYRYTMQPMKDCLLISIIGEAEGERTPAVKCFPCKDKEEAIAFMKKGLTQMPFHGHIFTIH